MLKQSLILMTQNGRYFRDEAELHADGKVVETIVQTTSDPLEAFKYDDYEEANEKALEYGFAIFVLNTYLEENPLMNINNESIRGLGIAFDGITYKTQMI